MEIAYAAHTESCTFMLDADGICRWVVASSPEVPEKARHWEKSQQAAARCIGAQYVASIDPSSKGGLVEMPRVGIPMLFARVDPHSGRISLVRTGTLMRFETRAPPEDDDWDSGLREPPRPRAYECEGPRTNKEPVPATVQESVEEVELEDLYEDHLRSEEYDPAEWENDTTRMPDDADVTGRRDPSTSDLYPTASLSSDRPSEPSWTDNTETTRFEVAQSALEQMRPTSSFDRRQIQGGGRLAVAGQRFPTLSTGLRPGQRPATIPPPGMRAVTGSLRPATIPPPGVRAPNLRPATIPPPGLRTTGSSPTHGHATIPPPRQASHPPPRHASHPPPRHASHPPPRPGTIPPPGMRTTGSAPLLKPATIPPPMRPPGSSPALKPATHPPHGAMAQTALSPGVDPTRSTYTRATASAPGIRVPRDGEPADPRARTMPAFSDPPRAKAMPSFSDPPRATTMRLPPPPANPRVSFPQTPIPPPPNHAQVRRPRVVTPLPAPPGYAPLTPPPAPPRRSGSGGNVAGPESIPVLWGDETEAPLRRAR